MTASRDGRGRVLPLGLTLLYAAVVARTAWISDDAAITLRAELNLAHGWGPNYNIAERVQAYTHPLWFALIAAANGLLGNVFAATFALSFLFAILAFLLATNTNHATGWAAIGGLVLVSSKAFVDYSTSGLENPLAYVLLALFVWQAEAGLRSPASPVGRLVLLASFIYLTRPDLGLIIAPLLLAALWGARGDWGRALGRALAGALPAIVWTIFSIIYYGFPFPNTAYAKLGNGVDGWDLLRQGGYYFLDSLDRDPLTLLAVALAVVLGLHAQGTLSRGLALGIVLYLLYVARIGGDFMSGRFFSVPVYVAVLILARLPDLPVSVTGTLAVAVAVLGLVSPNATLLSGSRYSNDKLSLAGIADERGYFYQRWGLLSGSRERFADLPPWPDAGGARDVVDVREMCGGLGYAGLYAGPWVHFVDRCGLSDPLLARLPPSYNPNWRVGHFERAMPDGYLDSVRASANLLRDERLKAYYDALRLITRAPLDAPGRFDAVLRMNLGSYDDLIDRRYGAPADLTVSAGTLDAVRAEGSRWNAPGNVVIRRLFPVTVAFPVLQTGKREIDLSLDSNDEYRISFMHAGQPLGSLPVGPRPLQTGGLTRYVMPLPSGISTAGFDSVVVEAIEGDGSYSLGHLIVR